MSHQHVAVFDASDQLILCNRQYARSHAGFDTAEAATGIRFEDLVRASGGLYAPPRQFRNW